MSHVGPRTTLRLIHTDIQGTRVTMVPKTLAERFAATRGAPQTVDGTLVHSIYRRSVDQGTALTLRWIHAAQTPRQGIRIKLDRGTVVVSGQTLKDVVLWADTSPGHVQIICETGKRPSGELRVWNCWMDEQGVMQAWIGDAGMVVEDSTGARVRIKCSDGTHRFAPSDLVFELLFEQ